MKKLNVKIGINPISWANDDLPSLGGETPLETILKEGKAIGYQGFELGNKFPRDPEALKKTLAPYGFECVSGWYSGRLADEKRTVEEEIKAVESHLRLLAENGSKVMVYGEVHDAIQGEIDVPLRKRPRYTKDEQWKAYGDKLNKFGAHLLKRGVKLGYHHHMGAYVQAPEDVDKLMSVTDENVGLLFDTGHMTFAGGNAVEMLKKHIKRVCHVHCKDVRPYLVKLANNRHWSFLNSVLNGVFTVPGDGGIDFSAVLKVLQDNNYSGWLVVEAEQDPAIAPSYEYADKGYKHLKGIIQKLEGAA